MNVTTIILIVSTLIGVGASIILFIKLRAKERQSIVERKEVEIKISKARKDAKKRSGAVVWGKAIEHFVPFTEKFPVPAEDCTFLGMPIDFVAFSDTGSKTKCKVHFIEVKSGNSFLMGKQKNIKEAIEQGRVEWHEISIEGNSME